MISPYLRRVTLAILVLSATFAGSQTNFAGRWNVIIFVADGLRPGSVNPQDTPTLWSIRQQGVNFANSHSLFPTFTMANASAIATGHTLGDTGIFSNVLWTGYPTYSGTPVPFIENDQMLTNIRSHFNESFPTEKSLSGAAAQQGYNVASIGKLGPAALFSIGVPQAVIIDDSTGSPAGFPVPTAVLTAMKNAGLSADAPTRSNGYGATSSWNNGYAGNVKQPGTHQANVVQQEWFADVTTKAILPMFQREQKPFILFYWSRDPDGTQHNQGDSLGALSPGINGKTVQLAVRNADRNLKQILDWLDKNPAVKANTDIVVTADHGFATISKRDIAPDILTASEAARHNYVDANGNVETEKGTLPFGFLAIDLALGLQTNLFDPDQRSASGSTSPFRRVQIGPDKYERPSLGNGLLGSEVRKEDASDAVLIVAANGGSDLIYVPDRNPETVRHATKVLTTFDYVGGIFVDDAFGAVPGALPMSHIGLVGSTTVPRPAIVVAFKVFYVTPGNLQTAIQISDSSQQHGQGMHGGLGRESTFNNMAAIGPDFKTRYVDNAPVSNADIAPTLAHILGIDMPSTGTLRGRVMMEALRGKPPVSDAAARQVESAPADSRKTILHFHEFNGVRYIDRGCFLERASSCP